ncbi:GAF and ANTAR domain-containing protein [Pseudonocardia endophytica]|uniref:GAF domain-containing protein n=1 Tax=Pseudonocardia endophytica TaxID=401976 RepID=A0A4R1HKW4_PSEEN|nr:GAF and ANTAR domain-containing protein [Pseudonocardia endophytica]TCK23064.1 GAF domain-containing protein [Pseudonocardia endophytica]
MSDDVREWETDRERFVGAQGSSESIDVAGDLDGLDEAGPLARQFTQLTQSLLSASSVGEVLIQVIAGARRIIPAVHLASVTLRDTDGSFHTPVETDPIAVELDQVQYRSGRGPCVESARRDGPAMAIADDLATDGRWPEFAAASVRAGFGSILATSLMPDRTGADLPGALNLYSRGRTAFTPSDVDRALLLATHASLALATTAAVSAADLERSQLKSAIASRDVIGQAKGILMARRGLTADDAFDVLRRTSQDINVKLVDLATTVTQRPDALDTR